MVEGQGATVVEGQGVIVVEEEVYDAISRLRKPLKSVVGYTSQPV